MLMSDRQMDGHPDAQISSIHKTHLHRNPSNLVDFTSKCVYGRNMPPLTNGLKQT